MSPRSQAILIGGMFIGVLSALPIVSVANCCCLWVIGGGMVTSYLLQQGQPGPLSLGDGSVAGCLAGIVGAAVYAAVSIPVQLLTLPIQRQMAEMLRGSADIPPEVADLVEQFGGVGVGAILFGFVFMLVLGTIFATLGGLLGAVVFGRGRPAPVTRDV